MLKSPKTYMDKLEIMHGSCAMFEFKSCTAQNQESIDFGMEISGRRVALGTGQELPVTHPLFF